MTTPNIEELIADLKMYAGDNGYGHIDYADTMRNAADALQSQAERIEELNAGMTQVRLERDHLRAQLAALQVDDELPELPDFKFACEGGALFQPTEMRAYARQAQAQVRAKMVPLEKDAARYVWWAEIVASGEFEALEKAFEAFETEAATTKEAIDAAIDAAMGITGEPE